MAEVTRGVRLRVRAVRPFERDVKLRPPFRFGAATLTEAPQAFARARVALEGGREARGTAAELLVPNWFDRDPQLSDQENLEPLRASLRLAARHYCALPR